MNHYPPTTDCSNCIYLIDNKCKNDNKKREIFRPTFREWDVRIYCRSKKVNQ